MDSPETSREAIHQLGREHGISYLISISHLRPQPSGRHIAENNSRTDGQKTCNKQRGDRLNNTSRSTSHCPGMCWATLRTASCLTSSHLDQSYTHIHIHTHTHRDTHTHKQTHTQTDTHTHTHTHTHTPQISTNIYHLHSHT